MRKGVIVVTHNQQRAVKRWLYHIRRREYSLQNITEAIQDLQLRILNPPSSFLGVNPIDIERGGGGGGEQTTKPEAYAIWAERLNGKLLDLQKLQDDHERKTKLYQKTLIALEQEFGETARILVEKKYFYRVRPDRAIYTMFLFCSKPTFYRLNNQALQFFFDVLPSEFHWTKD